MFLALMMLLGTGGQQNPADMTWQPGERPLHVYISTGDNLFLPESQPLDTSATIKANFERIAKTYRASRVYWRGESLRIRVNEFELRPENPQHYDFWTDVKAAVNTRKINEVAVQEAKRHGMEIFMVEGLFDHGAPGETGGAGRYPFPFQDKLALQHPEWVATDRWGERQANGVIQLCYAEARQALIQRYLRSSELYDGVLFYTYVENYGTAYEDEYGFNQPIVSEFKRRHGVDIRTQPFDKQAWYKLRGEYVTQFLKELHDALKARGKKLAVGLSPGNPNHAQHWPDTKTPQAEMAYLDYEAWIDRNFVDEIGSWYGGDPHPLVNRILPKAKARGVAVRIFAGSPFSRFNKDLIDKGVVPVPAMVPKTGTDFYTFSRGSMGGDWNARAQLASDARSGRGSTGAADLARLVRDENVLVRREALLALGHLRAAAHVGVLEGALQDPEPSVRSAAAVALKSVHGSGSAGKLLGAVERFGGFQLKEAAVDALQAMGSAGVPAAVTALSSGNTDAREVAARALEDVKQSGATSALVAAASDSSATVRYYAAMGLAKRRDGQATPTLLSLLDDRSEMVRLVAASGASGIWSGFSQAQVDQLTNRLTAMFKSYGGDGSAWQWRVVGDALNRIPAGKARLEALREDGGASGWRAYQVLHVPANPQIPTPITEQQAIQLRRQYGK